MVRSFLKRLISFGFVATLAACGGNNDITSQSPPLAEAAPLVRFDANNVLGYWQPQAAGGEAYEFYATDLNAALQNQPLTVTKTGRIFKSGDVTGMFYWSINTDGSALLTKVATSCSTRPLDKCPAIGAVTISATGKTLDGATWTRSAAGDTAKTSDVYTHPKLDLTGVTGAFLMNAAELFTLPTSAQIGNGKMTILTQELGRPVQISAQVPSAAVDSLAFPAGEATGVVVAKPIPTTSGKLVSMPVKVWLDNVVLSAGSGKGFILTFEIHSKVQSRSGVDPASLVLGDIEKTTSGTDAFGRIDAYVHGPSLQANQTYYSMVPFLFNQTSMVAGAGNVIQFTSGTEGVISHSDLHNGKYSESVRFKWSQAADGTLSFTPVEGLAAGLPVTVRFIKAVNGGHQVVMSFPDPASGTTIYSLSDFVTDAPASVTASTLPGKYVFDSTDGLTKNEVTLHRDGTVTGVVGGHWFVDANGDVISYECTDLQGKDLLNYSDCLKTFDSVDVLKTFTFAHIRKMRFMHTSNAVSQVRYDSVFYGSRFDVVNRDYAMVAWTYRFTRVGDE